MPLSPAQQMYYMERLSRNLSCVFANSLILSMIAVGTAKGDVLELCDSIDAALATIEDLFTELGQQAAQTAGGDQ